MSLALVLATRTSSLSARRALSSSLSARRAMGATEVLAASADLTRALEAPQVTQQLAAARAGGDTLVKWVTCNMMLTSQLVAMAQRLPDLGGGNEAISHLLDLLHAGPAVAESADAADATLAALREQTRARWALLLRHGFGCELGPDLELSRARELAIALVDAYQAPTFLRKVSELMRGELMGALSDLEKQQAVTRLMILRQKEAAVPFGYSSSDEGYAQAQAALQVYVTDAVIHGSIMQGTQRVYLTAGIDMNKVMQLSLIHI